MSRKRMKKPRKAGRSKKPTFQRLELKLAELKAILERTKEGPLRDDERDKLLGAVDTLAFLTSELEKKGVSINRLRKLLFGARTEKTSLVVAEVEGTAPVNTTVGKKSKKKRNGHGKNGAATYRGAEKVKVPHETLKSGDPCPECPKGKVYSIKEPAVLVRVTGMAPLQAKVYEQERLRCNLCGLVFTAKVPEGVGTAKYDESAAAMIALLKYGTGMPFNRLERLQAGLGIPLPASTQWDVVKATWSPPMRRSSARQPKGTCCTTTIRR